MTREEVVELMETSRTPQEWNYNCDLVKKTCGGYPEFWYEAILASGLADRVLKRCGRPDGAALRISY